MWSRVFNWPNELNSQETLWLAVEPLPDAAQIRLNGQLLDTANPSGRFDISQIVSKSNHLEIVLPDTLGADESECPLDVRLEVHEG